jgi:hypothetical protein
MPSRIWTLSKAFLSSPARAAEASRDEDNLAPCLWIYAACTLATMLFFTLKPFDFPDQSAAYPREFWFKAMLWQPPLEAAWMAFLLGLAVWFRQGSLPLRLALGVAWAAAPLGLSVYSVAGADAHIAKWALGLEAAALCLLVPLWRRLARAEVLPVVIFMLGVNVIGIVMLAPMVLAALLRSSNFFMATQVVGGFWILGWGTLGLRELTGLRLPRAFMAVLLSMFFQIQIAVTLYMSGLMSKGVLKALMFYA